VRSAGARKGAALPAPAGVRGGPGRSHGCGQCGDASFDADSSLAHDGGQGGGRPGGAQVRDVRVTAFYRRRTCSTKDGE
jgi:hypothetical protein